MASTVKLKTSEFVRYSPSEKALFEFIPKNGQPIGTDELAKAFYKGKRAPFNSQNVVTGFLRKLEMKVKANKEAFRLRRSQRAGPHCTEVWIER